MSALREAPNKDGTKGPVSFRRCAAAFFAVSGVSLAAYGVVNSIQWQGLAVLLGVPVFAVLVLAFFTTWSDVSEIISALKGKG